MLPPPRAQIKNGGPISAALVVRPAGRSARVKADPGTDWCAVDQRVERRLVWRTIGSSRAMEDGNPADPAARLINSNATRASFW